MQNEIEINQIAAEEHALHAACVKGDLAAERRLYERYKSKMFSMCLRYADNRGDAEDMLQEGFLTVFRDLKGFRCEGSLEGWIRRVILNIVFKTLKAQRAVKSFELKTEYLEGAPDTLFETDSTQENTTQELLQMMQNLPTGFRTVLNLYILEGYTHKEISEILGISIGTSKSQLLRAKAALRQMFEKKLTS